MLETIRRAEPRRRTSEQPLAGSDPSAATTWREAVAYGCNVFRASQRRGVQYVVAAVSMGLALWLALALQAPLGDHVFALFISAVMISAWNGGLGPGLLGAILGTGAMDYFFEEPSYSFEIASSTTGLQMLTFLFAAMLISSLSNNLRMARQRAEVANREREELVHSITHDLKTPLTAIRAFATLSRHQAERLQFPQADRLDGNLRTIETTCTRMAALLDELLDTQQLEAGHPLQLQHDHTDLLALCERKAAEYMVVDPRRPVRVSTTASELVGCWDRRRLERVLDNLLTNALKYGEAGSAIRIELATELDTQGEWAVLRVRDSGPGIAPDELCHLFDRYYRGQEAVRRAPGLGLGLAGVRSIVELHGGSISVESALGRGSTFIVRLPL